LRSQSRLGRGPSFRPGLDKSRSKMMMSTKDLASLRLQADLQAVDNEEEYEMAVRRYFAAMERPPRSLVIIW
jgi:hypothetical protein